MVFRVCEWSKLLSGFVTHPATWDFETLEDAIDFLREHGYSPSGEGWGNHNKTAQLIVMGE